VTRLRTLRPRVATLDTRTVKTSRKEADPELLTPEHRAWRDAVLRRAGHRCEWVERGQRCTKAAPAHRMFADHIVERRDGGALYDPANGRCLCGSHHTRVTAAARARRTAERA
jgi:5-methylcytosine-specific restriction enzyme A